MTAHWRGAVRHAAVIGIAIAVVIAGLVSWIGQADRHAALAMEAGQRLQISAGGTSGWSDAIDPVWTMDNMSPGSTMAGTVYLRAGSDAAGDDSPGMAMFLESSGGLASFAAILRVESMAYGGVDILGRWLPCAGTGGALTLGDLQDCDTPPILPMPPGGGGLPFSMSLRMLPDAGNTFQGATYGPVTVVFALTSLTGTPTPVPSPVSPVTPTPTPEAPTPTLPAGETPTPATPPATPPITPGAPVVPPSPTPATPPGEEPPAALITALIEVSAPMDLSDFVLGVEGAGLQESAPGGEIAVSVPPGQPYTLTAYGPATLVVDGLTREVVLEAVDCASSEGGILAIEVARSITLHPDAGESVHCVFQFAPGAPADTRPPPAPPAAGSGRSSPEAEYRVVGALAVGAVVLLISGAMWMRSRRRIG